MSELADTQDFISQRISEISTQYDQHGVAALAQAYEDFKKEVAKAEAAAYKGEAGKLVLQRINDLETLFTTVTGNDVKELSMFMKDSEALRRTAEFASLNANNIQLGNLDDTLLVDEFVRATKIYMNPDYTHERSASSAPMSETRRIQTFNSLNWMKVGAWFYLKSNVPVPSHFLNGPLATQRRRVTQRARAVDDTTSTTNKITAQSVTTSTLQDDPEQSTSHMVRTVYGILRENDGDVRVNLYRFFINPNSFAQSVENLFYTSFLVRDGKLEIGVDDKSEPYVIIPDEESDDMASERSAISHHIASLNMPAWQHLIEKYGITESYIPHREEIDAVVTDDDELDD